MEFDGRTWTYLQKRMPLIPYTLLTGVQPPLGPAWRFEYRESTAFGDPAPWILEAIRRRAGGVSTTFSALSSSRWVLASSTHPPSRRARLRAPESPPGPGTTNTRSTDWRDPGRVLRDLALRHGVRYTFKAIGPCRRRAALGHRRRWRRRRSWTPRGAVLERSDLEWERSAPISQLPRERQLIQDPCCPLDESQPGARAAATRPMTRSTPMTSVRTRRRPRQQLQRFRPAQGDRGNRRAGRRTTRTFFYGTSTDPSFGTLPGGQDSQRDGPGGHRVLHQLLDLRSGHGLQEVPDDHRD